MENCKKEIEISSSTDKTILIKYYEFIHNDKIDLRETYNKKEAIILLKEIIKLYKNNYCCFIDNLHKHIKQQKCQKIIIKDILTILPKLESFENIINKIKIIDDFISKKDALFLIDHARSSSYKYIKSKNQQEGIK